MVVTVSPGLTLHNAARAMSERKVGAAVVIDPEQPGPGIITERDVLQSVGSGQDPNSELVRDHLSPELTFAAPPTSGRIAAAVARFLSSVAMVRGALLCGGAEVEREVRWCGRRTRPGCGRGPRRSARR